MSWNRWDSLETQSAIKGASLCCLETRQVNLSHFSTTHQFFEHENRAAAFEAAWALNKMTLMKIKSFLTLRFLLIITFALSASDAAWATRRHRQKKSDNSFESGLCVQKNQNMVQAQGKNSYCTMLRQIVDDPKSCAHKAISQLVTSDGSVNGLSQFCSAYSSLDSGTDFYYQLLSVMAYSESGWNPRSTGDHGRSRGLMQISVTDRGNYSDCGGLTAKNIEDPYTNLKCGSCIAMTWLAKDRQMGSGHAGTRSARGIARYFGPFGSGRSERTNIASATNSFCSGNSQDQLQYASLGGSSRSPASNGRIQMAYAIGLTSH